MASAKTYTHEVAEFPAISCEISAASSGLQRITHLRPASSFQVTLLTDYFLKEILAWLKSYSNRTPHFDVPIDMGYISSFHKQVLEKMEQIPFGQIVSYKDLAESIGCPAGARAVGNACNKNPLPLLFPCHRVVGSDGSLRGFAGGIEVKKRLLDFELTRAGTKVPRKQAQTKVYATIQLPSSR